MTAIGEVLLVVGASMTLIAGIGVIRFRSVFERMHAAAKAPALGIVLIGLGVMLSVRTANAVAIVSLVVVLQLIAVPVSTHLLGHAVYHRLDPELDDVDELASDTESDDG